ELGQLAGVDGVELERRAANGYLDPIIATATGLRERGLGTALITLGGAGAVLVDDDEVWHARSGPVRVRSTVGAGDSSLAGYLLAESHGLPPRERLAWAVAHGATAASLDGTGLPLGLDPTGVEVTLSDSIDPPSPTQTEEGHEPPDHPARHGAAGRRPRRHQGGRHPVVGRGRGRCRPRRRPRDHGGGPARPGGQG